MIYAKAESQLAWANAAAAKLRADGVDPADLGAVETALIACGGGRRLFRCWLAVYGPPRCYKMPGQRLEIG